jgi:hypothetical protein
MTAAQRTTQILKAIAEPVTSLPEAFNRWLAKFPSTNGRIFFTIVAMMITTARYCFSAGGPNQWAPSGEWLSFLAVMAGVDTLQFFAKRKTHEPPTSNQEAPQQ